MGEGGGHSEELWVEVRHPGLEQTMILFKIKISHVTNFLRQKTLSYDS